MRASEANKHARSLFLGFVFFVLVAVCTCEALSSTECKQAVAEKYKNGEQDCGHPVCGYLEVDQTAPKFLESLSLQCQALMWDYRVDTSPMLGITSAAARVCATSKDAYQPTNPIIVETDDVNNFMMCTVPRAASTSLRQLLNMLIRLPDQPRPAIKDQQWDAHFDVFPTVWHYRMDSHPTYDTYPSFIIGRNPYTRLLSGFLNKMTISIGQPDSWTAKAMNAALDMGPTKIWHRTPESFHEFVLALRKRRHGVSHLDAHFRLATRACSFGIQYEYYLRIEDLALWLPCVERGLGLRDFTRHGWQRTDEGLLHIGTTAADEANNDCWWKPPGMTCAEFYELMVDEAGEVVPVRTKAVAEDFRLHEGRDDGTTGNWRDFYTAKIGEVVYKLYEEDFTTFGYGKELFD